MLLEFRLEKNSILPKQFPYIFFKQFYCRQGSIRKAEINTFDNYACDFYFSVFSLSQI